MLTAKKYAILKYSLLFLLFLFLFSVLNYIDRKWKFACENFSTYFLSLSLSLTRVFSLARLFLSLTLSLSLFRVFANNSNVRHGALVNLTTSPFRFSWIFVHSIPFPCFWCSLLYTKMRCCCATGWWCTYYLNLGIENSSKPNDIIINLRIFKSTTQRVNMSERVGEKERETVRASRQIQSTNLLHTNTTSLCKRCTARVKAKPVTKQTAQPTTGMRQRKSIEYNCTLIARVLSLSADDKNMSGGGGGDGGNCRIPPFPAPISISNINV